MTPSGQITVPLDRPPDTAPSSSGSIAGYRFGPFRLCATSRILERDGERIPLTPKVVDTLLILVENAGQVVTKEELMQSVWPDVTVVDSGLTRNVSVLRRALETGVEEGTYLETIPRRGYRFVAGVEQIPATDPCPTPAAVAVERRSRVWPVAAAAVLATGIGSLLALSLDSAPTRAAGQEPLVRIGEHLLYKLAPGESAKALRYFENAVAQNPRSADAHAGLAVSLMHLASLGSMEPEMQLRVVSAAHKAVQLDPRSGTARSAHGLALATVGWRFDEADAELQRAMELEPGSVQTLFSYSVLKLATGRVHEARRLVEEALRLDPASPALGAQYCKVFYYSRDFERAAFECRQVLDREPGYTLAQYYLALSLGFLGRTGEAMQVLNDSRLAPDVVATDRVWISLQGGDRKPAEARLDTLRELVRRGKIDGSSTLLLAAALGYRDEAFEAIDAALESRASELLTLSVDPRLATMRTDPRFEKALRRAGLHPDARSY